MTVQRNVVRLDESKVVVLRKVPMTDDTSNKLRQIRKHYEKLMSNNGVDVELPYPVVIDKIINEIHTQLWPEGYTNE